MTEPQTHTLDVAGAVLTYDVRANDSSTEPVLLLIGSPMGAGGFLGGEYGTTGDPENFATCAMFSPPSPEVPRYAATSACEVAMNRGQVRLAGAPSHRLRPRSRQVVRCPQPRVNGIRCAWGALVAGDQGFLRSARGNRTRDASRRPGCFPSRRRM
ncbi:MAG: hypothetical protein QOH48_999 [Actinomycetota bacterium]|jgi:hypothetical protein|nr:hypothetical protein [Actinomycetota bacterium]